MKLSAPDIEKSAFSCSECPFESLLCSMLPYARTFLHIFSHLKYVGEGAEESDRAFDILHCGDWS